MKIVFRDNITPIPCKLRSIIKNLYTTSSNIWGGTLLLNNMRLINEKHFILTNNRGKTYLLNCIIVNSRYFYTYDRKQINMICFRVLNIGKNYIPIPDSEICNMFSSISNDWVDWQT